MRDQDFRALSKFAYKHAGIVLGDNKKSLLYSRISRRIRQLGLTNFSEYVAFLNDEKNQEVSDFLNIITTNLTSFFRESHHFEFLKNKVFPEIESENPSKVRFWSAGCSTGEEPYSIAMTVLNEFALKDKVKILATDLDANVLAHARRGEYELERFNQLDKSLYKKHFNVDATGKKLTALPQLRELIRFNRLNLFAEWPMRGEFQVIFCRNVLIYFDKETQQQLVHRFLKLLEPGGYLIIGHSENISHFGAELSFIGKTIYQKAGG